MKISGWNIVTVSVACAIVATVSATSSFARIIGLDDRRSVSYEESQRYRAIGIVAIGSEKRVYGGTGTLVNDQLTVLTAYHNVYHDGNTGPIGRLKAPLDKVYFLVGDHLQKERTFYRVRWVSPFRLSSSMILPDENDIAVLKLREPVRGAQPLLLRSLGPEEDGQGLGEVTHVAFHKDRDDGLNKMIQECRFRERPSMASYPRSPNVLLHDCDSEGVASGSPFLDRSNRIVAVHLGGSPLGRKIPGKPFHPTYNSNVARRVTLEVQQFVDREDQVP